MEDDDTNEGENVSGNEILGSSSLSRDGNTTVATDDLPDLSATQESSNNNNNALRINCSYCNRKFSRESSYKRHLQTHLQDPIKCEYCGRICPKKSVLIKHLRTHTGEKPYECEVCQLQFATKPSLDYHLAVHKGERPFICDYCGKGFIQNSHLTRHLRVHTGEKPYCCTYCDMKFSRQGSLQVHLRRHTGEVLFTCTHCDRKFTNESTFKYHLKKLSGQKPFVCRFCGWSFISSSHLRKHEKVHLRNENFEDSKYKWIKKSLNHDSGIKQELPFQSCKDSKTDNGNKLNAAPSNTKNVKMRTTTRNYHCPYCPLKFIRRSALQSHLTFHEAQTQLGHQEFLYQSSTIKIKNENECLVIPVICDMGGRMKTKDNNQILGGSGKNHHHHYPSPNSDPNNASTEILPDWNNSSDSERSESFLLASSVVVSRNSEPSVRSPAEDRCLQTTTSTCDDVTRLIAEFPKNKNEPYLNEFSNSSILIKDEERLHRIRANHRKNPFPRKLVRRT